MNNRETVYSGFFNFLAPLNSANGGLFKTLTRRLKHWKDVSKEDQPALYMEHTGEVFNPVRGLPTRVVLEVNLWVYVTTDEQAVGPILSPVLDSISQLLAPEKGEQNLTINGLVHHCWIEGQVQIFEGDLGDEAVAIIPVKLLVT